MFDDRILKILMIFAFTKHFSIECNSLKLNLKLTFVYFLQLNYKSITSFFIVQKQQKIN